MAKGLNIEAKRRDKMLNTPIGKLVTGMALPTVVAMLVTSAYSIADTYFVSSLGTEATAAVGVNMSIEQVIMMAGSFLAVGSNSYIARLLGGKQTEKASKTLSTAFFTAILLGVLIAVPSLIFLDPLIDFLGATEGSRDYAKDYASFILIAAPFMASGFVLSQCLRSEGAPIYSMIGLVAGAVLNIALDPLLIFTLDLGVRGAAIATLISKSVSLAILLIPYLRKKTMLCLSVKQISPSRDIVREISLMGLPSLLRIGLSVVCFILINNLAGSYSDSALAAISVATRIMTIPTFAILGFGQGFMPVAGYNWGANRYDRVRKAFKFSSIAAVTVIALVSALMCIFAEQIILLFAEDNPELLELGVLCLRAEAIIMPLGAWVTIVNMLYSALGRAVGAIILGAARQGFCYLPVFFILPKLLDVTGIAITQAAADILTFLVVIPFAFHIMKYVKKTEQDELPLPEASAE